MKTLPAVLRTLTHICDQETKSSEVKRFFTTAKSAGLDSASVAVESSSWQNLKAIW